MRQEQQTNEISQGRKSKWLVISGTVWKLLCVVFTFYYLVTISFRLAFRCPVELKKNFLYPLLLDYAIDLFFWCGVFIRFFEKVNHGAHKVHPDDGGSSLSRFASSLSGLPTLSRLASRQSTNNMNTRMNSSHLSRQQIAPVELTTNSTMISKPSRRARLLKSFSSFADYDIFSNSGPTVTHNTNNAGSDDGRQDSFSESDLLSNFQKNQEDHEMLISIKESPSNKAHYMHDILEFLMLCPFELFGYLVGYQYYYLLRSFRLLRLFHIPFYFNAVTRILVDSEFIVGASARRVLYLTIFMVLFAHVGACVFYALGLWLLDNGVTDVWLTFDGMVSFYDDETVGENNHFGAYYFNDPVGYRYVRVLYWAVVTSQTVGFGDVRPRTIQETSFCLVFFYLSHFLCAQLAIGNLLLLFDVYDSAQTQYKGRIEQLEIYAQFRKLPPDLKDRITYFYYHQWKVLKGLDESQLLKELPNNIIIKVKQATIRNYLLKVPFLKRLKMMVLNALVEDVKLIIFSPSDVIVPIDSISTGMYMISRGEAFISSNDNKSPLGMGSPGGGGGSEETPQILQAKPSSGDIDQEIREDEDEEGEGEGEGDKAITSKPKRSFMTQSLTQGDCFGVTGLIRKYEQTLSLNAGTTVCEVLFLSRVRFQRTISLLLSKEEAKPYMEQETTSVNSPTGEKTRRIHGYQKALSHVRASAVLNVETSEGQTSEFILRLKTDGDIRTAWDVLIFWGIGFYSLSIPFNLSHAFKHQMFTADIFIFSFGFLMDIIFFLDILARMFLFPAYSKSVLMTSSWHIFAVYKEQYPFFIELLSVIPFDFIALLDPNLLPILRLFKIYHLSKFRTYGNNAEKALTKYFKFSLSFSTSRFIRLQMGLFELCHWAACLWQLVADFSIYELNADTNWKIQDRDAEYLSIKYKGHLDESTAYIRSLYWAINALSTSGVADMPSTNIAEMLFVCFALLLGCQSINAVLGSIASMMGNINKSKSDFSNKMDTISKYMKFKRLPVRLQLKIRFFFEYNFQRTSGVDEMQLLAGLPQPLREDVVVFVVGSVLIGIPFFSHCSEPMLEMILGLLTRRCFLNNDDVVLAGEYGKDFFIIESGMILVTSADKAIVYANLKHGHYIGESCLLKVVQRTASAHARDYSETYVLKKTDFENVVDVFPEDGKIVKTKINDLLAARDKQNKLFDVKKSRRSMVATFVRMESIHSLDTSDLTLWDTFLEEYSYPHKLWRCFLLFIVLYNLFMIPLRLAFTKDSFVLYYIMDYSFDIILWIDMYLNAYKFRRIIGKVT